MTVPCRSFTICPPPVSRISLPAATSATWTATRKSSRTSGSIAGDLLSSPSPTLPAGFFPTISTYSYYSLQKNEAMPRVLLQGFDKPLLIF
ncbi:unnamed protein product [Linum tenue]|uniref:Uncharacterized protein n=1 Tax=Linum tenue TaxID=586396 RepID=A0AAV0R4S2_9ROSI|nr:unnamed protein product [Linum tenue]